jgi:hypothetical protein
MLLKTKVLNASPKWCNASRHRPFNLDPSHESHFRDENELCGAIPNSRGILRHIGSGNWGQKLDIVVLCSLCLLVPAVGTSYLCSGYAAAMQMQ